MFSAKGALRRSRRNRILFGVCGGLGEFFGVSVFWFRQHEVADQRNQIVEGSDEAAQGPDSCSIRIKFIYRHPVDLISPAKISKLFNQSFNDFGWHRLMHTLRNSKTGGVEQLLTFRRAGH